MNLTKGDHDPKANGCGCQCGDYSGSDYPIDGFLRFHGGHGSPQCLCACGAAHINFQASACPNACYYCHMNADSTKSGMDIHTWAVSNCVCQCDMYTDHRYPDDNCVCYCYECTRAHDYQEIEKRKIGEYDCQTCGNHIIRYHSKYRCRRSACQDEYEGDWDDGHEPWCGDDPDDPNPEHRDPVYCACGCMIYAGQNPEKDGDVCGCSSCRNHTVGGTCRMCGGTCGEAIVVPSGKIPPGHDELDAGDIWDIIGMWADDPETIDGDDPVYVVGDYALTNAFVNNPKLKTVKFNYLHTVGDNGFAGAFAGCTNLVDVQLGALKNVGNFAFMDAFRGCVSLKNLDLGTVENLSTESFSADGDDSDFRLDEIRMPLVRDIPVGCFTGLNVKEFYFENATNIGYNAFENCARTQKIVIPHVKSIKSSAFSCCYLLNNLVAPEVEYVETGAFAECSSLREIDFPGIKDIGRYGFNGLGGVRVVTLNNVTNAGYGAFMYTAVEEVHMTNLVHAGYGCFASSYNLRILDVPNLETVDDEAFLECTELKELVLPKLRKIGTAGFGCLVSVTNIEVNALADIPKDGFSQAYELITFSATNVTSIGRFGLGECMKMVSANIPNVTSVGRYGFAADEKITEIHLPKVTDTTKVGPAAFKGCNALQLIELGVQKDSLGAIVSQITRPNGSETMNITPIPRYQTWMVPPGVTIRCADGDFVVPEYTMPNDDYW